MAARRHSRAVVAGVLALGVGGAAACVLADPPAPLPTPPIEQPEILRFDVQPPAPFLTGEVPLQFVIPVVADSREPQLEYQFVVDPGSPDQISLEPGFQPVEPDGGVEQIFVTDPPAVLSPECHTFQFFVFYPDDSNAGDSFTWYYSATNDFTGCPVFDAGPEGGDE
ncbi:MAG: hypothetical protein ACLQVI_42815 [Polyangiaceae bacterium]